MIITPATVLDYAPRQPGRARQLWGKIARCLLILIASAAVGGLIAWSITPVVYIDLFRIYEEPNTTGARPNQLYARAAELQFSAFVKASVATLVASGKLSTKQLERASIHAELGRRDDVITVSVEHPDPDVAAVLTQAIVTAAIKPPPSIQSIVQANPKDAMAQAIAAVVTRTVLLDPPRPASALKPRPTAAGWAVLLSCHTIVAVAFLVLFRRYIARQAAS